MSADPRLARITVYPVKSLDGVSVDDARVVENGGRAGDREFALVDDDGGYVNGKRERAVHAIRAETDLDARTVTLSAPDVATRTFDLPNRSIETTPAETQSGTASPTEANEETGARPDVEALCEWVAGYLGYDVDLKRETAGGFPDDTTAAGPTVISTATIEAVASWFPGVDVDGMRRRLRPNLELDGVPAFWEDRLFANRDHVVPFSIGDVAFEGVNPCQRCVVPSRDPETGEEYDGFRRQFVERRRETMPSWSGGDWFDHHFRVMVNTRTPRASWGERLTVGDAVTVGSPRPAE